jgi:hypothetical protein
VVEGGLADCAIFSVPVLLPDGPVVFSLRPEAIAPASLLKGDDLVTFPAQVIAQQFHGAHTLVALRCSGGLELTARIATSIGNGDSLECGFRAEDCVPLEKAEHD